MSDSPGSPASEAARGMTGRLIPFPNRGAARRRRRVLLLVQVSPCWQQRIHDAARARGHHVLLTAEVPEALALLDATLPDLVLVGGPGLGLGALISKIARDSPLGARPQLLCEDGSCQPDRVSRLLQLLEAE